jgi:hypothetical protein
MIILSEDRRGEAPELKSITSLNQPLPAQARRAVEAAAAVARGDVDLDQATRRYGIATALIEAWQHTLQALPPGGYAGKLRVHRC